MYSSMTINSLFDRHRLFCLDTLYQEHTHEEHEKKEELNKLAENSIQVDLFRLDFLYPFPDDNLVCLFPFIDW